MEIKILLRAGVPIPIQYLAQSDPCRNSLRYYADFATTINIYI